MSERKIDQKQLHELNINEPFVCLFSGGKDCGMALALARKRGKPIELIHCMENNISSNHKQNFDVIQKQAEAMGLPLSIIICDMRTNEYIYQLTKKLNTFNTNNLKTATSLVTGTQFDLHAYKIYSKICSNASMHLKCPLWGLSDDEILSVLEENKIKSIITTINDSKIDSKWLGKVYDFSTYTEFKKIGIHPFGEYNEFHTTLVDANFFQKKVVVEQIPKSKYQLDVKLILQ